MAYENQEFIVYSTTKSAFQSLVSSGRITNSQIGIISETSEFWAKGQYYPLVNLGEYLKKDDAVEFAKDLEGKLEATQEEFTFRPSAGDKSIRDESAVIRRIKGNTTVWGQLADITNVSNTGAIYIMETGDGWFSIQRDLSNTGTPYCYVNMVKQCAIPTHKYLLCQEIEVSGIVTSDDYCSAAAYNFTPYSGVNYTQNGKYSYTKILTKLDDTTFQFFYYAYGNAKLKASNLQCFDLTNLFGAGNEPTTVEEFKAVYPDIYPYCEPEIRNMRACGIETIGANAFNKDDIIGGIINADGTVTSNDIYSVAKIEVVLYEKYTLTNVANAANTTYTYALYDREDRFISVGEIRNSVTKPVSVSGDVIMPLNARYIRVVVHNDYIDSCCVNLKHSGTLTAEEATYFKEVRMLPDIAKYFHDGMNGIGKVYDEINTENAIRRIGVVDIGTLEWYAGSREHMFLAPIENAKPTVWNEVANAIMWPYTVVSRIEADTADMSFCVNNMYHFPNRLCLTNYNYEDAATFKAAMSGVYLYYELAEPIVTPITDPLQWDYKVADFGTEKMLSDLPSSPFRADIVYQFNAADRIRDNARNIERLEEHTKNMATMEDVINAIPTEVATATQLEEYTVTDGSQLLYPNIMYEFSIGGIGQTGEFVMPSIVTTANRTYDNRWMLRIAQITNGATLTFPYEIAWKDGLEPNIPTSGTLEIYLKYVKYVGIIGEWKFYPNI